MVHAWTTGHNWEVKIKLSSTYYKLFTEIKVLVEFENNLFLSNLTENIEIT